MPRYYFDVHDGKPMPDEEGIELPDGDAARRQVWKTLPMMAADREPNGDMACQFRMDVRDEAGKRLYHAALTLVIEAAKGS